MTTAQQDTEITLGTGRMMAIFFSFVLVCAFFFAIGFSLGRRTAVAGSGNSLNPPAGTPSTVVRPSAVKNGSGQPQSGDFSFYKALGAKNADAALARPDAKAQPAPTAGETTSQPATDATAVPTPVPPGTGYFVQVAAVSRQEDAESLVEALKKKQYPAFAASKSAADNFYHIQVGPYADLKEAEAMRARLIGDGYNPIVKK